MQIRSNRLLVEIDEPGQNYRGSRFDWTGFITQVTLDGRHTYCVPESLIPGFGTNGNGLSNEFGISLPTGFEDVQPGQQFPKIGIGLLTRPDAEPFKFSRQYEIQPFPFRVSAEPDAVTMIAEPLECRGYAVRLEKRIAVAGDELTIHYHLENVGSRPVASNEYAHNFIGINNHPIGPEYRLQLSCDVSCERTPPDILNISGNTIGWKHSPEEPFYCRTILGNEQQPGQWELVHEPSGVGMRETDSFPWAMIAVWGVRHVVSPEAFIALRLEPGEQQSWWRKYTFFAA